MMDDACRERRFERTDAEWERSSPAATDDPTPQGRWRDHRQNSTASCCGHAPACHGRTCPTGTAPARRWTNAMPAGVPMDPAAHPHPVAPRRRRRWELDWDAQIDSPIVRAHLGRWRPKRGAGRRPRTAAGSARTVAGGLTTNCTPSARAAVVSWAPSSPGQAPDSCQLPGCLTRSASHGQAGGVGPHPPVGPDRRQGLQQPRQPRLAAAAQARSHHPAPDDQLANRARMGARAAGQPPLTVRAPSSATRSSG